ncbi:MAG: amino acid ABC transporter substrate-binding protein [Bacteroidetes bacterium]|nr:MAG: amino acid ABC transporter substrate-binding protein [Bacteroidota bacterium]
MISAPNHRQLLSGNKFRLLAVLFLSGLLSCSAGKKPSYLTNQGGNKTEVQNEEKLGSEDKLKQEKEIKEQMGTNLPVVVNDFHVALFLPFSLHKDAERGTRDFIIREGVLDYYQGILLALDSLEREGIKLKLHVLDTRKDSLTTVKQLNKPEMTEMDLIIGPLDYPSFEAVSNFALKHDIPVVSPFSMPSKSRLPNPMAFYASGSLKSYGGTLAKYLLAKTGKFQVLYIGDGSTTDKEVAAGLEEGLKGSEVKFIKRKYVKDAKFRPLLQKDSVINVVIVASDDEQTVKSATWAYRSQDPEITDEDYTVELIGLDTWLGFRDPNFKLWENASLKVLSNFYTFDTDSNYLNFKNLYRAKFEIPASNLSLKGFDQMLFFGHALLAFGKQFPAYVQDTEFAGTGMDFYWHFNGTQVVNQAVRMLKFYDYRFHPLR